MGVGGGCTADVAGSVVFCRRAAGRMSSAALRTSDPRLLIASAKLNHCILLLPAAS